MLRRLLYGGSVLSLLACVAIVAMWVRSYHHADRLHGRLWDDRYFLVASKQGSVTVLPFRPVHPGYWKWEIRQYPVDHKWAFPSDDIARSELGAGFGLIRDPWYAIANLRNLARIAPASPSSPDFSIDLDLSKLSSRFSTISPYTTLRGTGLVLPYWFLVLLCLAIAAAFRLRRPWRFTTRSLLIAMTLIAALLGFMVRLQ